MPVVEAHILEGYAPEEKARLTTALTDAIRLVIPAGDDAITVMLHEMAVENYARGGQLRSPSPALPDPIQIVHDFLAAMEQRDLGSAKAMLAPEFRMIFPGHTPMATLGELVDWAKSRYRFVKKTITATEAFHKDGSTIVYVTGTLAGEWPDGAAFSGIRFIDRFAIKGGKLIAQDVWNDIAEVRGT